MSFKIGDRVRYKNHNRVKFYNKEGVITGMIFGGSLIIVRGLRRPESSDFINGSNLKLLDSCNNRTDLDEYNDEW